MAEEARFSYLYGKFNEVRSADAIGSWRGGSLSELSNLISEKRLNIEDPNRLAVHPRFIGIYENHGWRARISEKSFRSNLDPGEVIQEAHEDALFLHVCSELNQIYGVAKGILSSLYGIEDIFSPTLVAFGYVPGEIEPEKFVEEFVNKGIERIKFFSLADTPRFEEKEVLIGMELDEQFGAATGIVLSTKEAPADQKFDAIIGKYETQLRKFGLTVDQYINLRGVISMKKSYKEKGIGVMGVRTQCVDISPFLRKE